MISIDDIDVHDLENFGIFGQSYILDKSNPSLLELCRYCIFDEKDSKRLLQIFENKSTVSDYKKFKNKYRGNSNSTILNFYLHDIQTANNSDSDQILYHNSRRKWLTIVENTELRDYQIECSEAIKSNFYSKKSTLLVLPTGAGKTRTVIQSIRDILDSSSKPFNILWMVHTSALCLQAENAIHDAWIEPRKTTFHKNLWLNSTYSSGLKPTINMFGEAPSFTISTPDSIEKGIWNNDLKEVFDIIVCDEAHHGIDEQNRIFQKWPNSHLIGVTATPELVSNKKIFNILYSRLVYPESFVKKNDGKDWKDTKKILIKQEYLSDYGEVIDKYIEHETDRENLEFNKKKKWTDQPSSIVVAERLSREMLEEGCKRILLFVDGVPQARSIAGFLRDHGINSSAVYGALSQDERSSRINGFSSGHFEVLVSVNILREGIDVPLVDGILIMRKGTEIDDPMFTQMLGRGLRGPKSSGTKNCLVWHVN
jgi:DNA repair protein RadD